jgi:hypothetical protein
MKAVRFGLAVVAAVALFGCGGGGGGGTPAPLSGRAAAIDGVKGVYSYQQVGNLGDYSRSISNATGLAKYARMALQRGAPTRGVEWEYDEDWDLYYRYTVISSTHERVDFRIDPNDASQRGKIDLYLIDGEPYPVAVRMDFDIVGDQNKLKGSLTFTAYNDEFTDVRVAGGFTLQDPATNVSMNLRETDGEVTGTLSARVDGYKVVYTNIVYDGEYVTADWAAGGLTGTMIYNDFGAGSLTVNTPAGDYVISWNAIYECTLTNPDNSTEDLGFIWDL